MTFGFLSRQDDDLPTLVRESFEHPASLLVGSVRTATRGKPFEISGLILTRSFLSVKVAVDSPGDDMCSYAMAVQDRMRFIDFNKSQPIKSRTFFLNFHRLRRAGRM